MSGVKSTEDFVEVGQGRADAVLIGEGLMRSDDPVSMMIQWRRAFSDRVRDSVCT